MNQRVQRLAMEIREILGEIVTRQEIKDHRVQNVGLITLTHVRLTGDLQKATALFTVHGLDEPALRQVRDGLNHAGGYLRRRLGKELSVRTIPTVTFEIDKIFAQEERVDAILRDIAPLAPPPAETEDGDDDDENDSAAAPGSEKGEPPT
jgi:ribosome-binding factor A